MADKQFRMIAGLGNPGRKYSETRHNLGFSLVDRLASEFKISVGRMKFESVYGSGIIGDISVILVKPMAFMNRCGPPCKQLANYYGIESKDMLVIHDDIDLAFGRLKIKEKGGDGGHKGLRSLIDAFCTGDFPRLRIGIGRPGPGVEVTDYVLENFSKDEMKQLEGVFQVAADAVVTIITKGVKQGMNEFNNRSKLIAC